MILRVLFVLLWLLFPKFGSSQVKGIGLPELRNFKKSEYKGGTQNWGIDQDKEGRMYFANNSGLLQFDGTYWTKYSLPNNSLIRSLKVAASGRVYVGGYNEFGYFEPGDKGRLIYHSVAKLVDRNSINLIDFIWKIHVMRDKVVFQSFGRLYVFEDGKLTIVEAPKRFQFSFLVGDKLYLQDMANGILFYQDGKLIGLENTALFNSTEIWGMLSIGVDKLLIATLDKGIFMYEKGAVKAWSTEANSFVLKNSSLGCTLIKEDFIAINSVLDGEIICDKSGKIIQHLNRKKGMQNNTVLSSFVDSKGNLWLGLDNGIAFVNENSPFTYFGFSYELSTVYASVFHKGYLYVATNRGLFFHSLNSPFKEDTFTLVKGTTGQAWNIQVIDGQLFCGHNRGAMLIEDGALVKILHANGYWGFKTIPGRPGFLIGANYNGFGIFEKKASGWAFNTVISGMETSSSAFEVDEHSVWLKKDNDVYMLALSKDFSRFAKIRKFSSISRSFKGIGSVQKISGKVFFQTNNHFFKYSYEQELFYEDQKLSGFFRSLPKIRSLTQDAYGNLWFNFNESVGALMKQPDGSFKPLIPSFSNLTGNLVNDYLSVNTVDAHNIFIGLTDGLAHYDYNPSIDYVIKPTAFIRSFTFPGDTILLGNGHYSNRNFKIPYQSNSVKFTFSSPTFDNPDHIEYSYQLEGFDDRWSAWSTVSMKEYTNLHEGDYRMKVKVRNSYGLQSETALFSFTVAPPIYRHPLAYVFYMLLVVVSVYVIRQRIRLKIRKNKYYETIEQRRQYLEKEAKIRQEQYELEKEIEKLKNDKLQIKILAKDKELVNNSLQVVKKNKILNGIITKLKDIDSETMDESVKFQFNKLNKSIVKEVNTDKSWKDLEKHIKNVHFDFLKRLKEKYPNISPREMDLSTYLLMNMSTKEIAEIMNISNGGVELARYRLRKKLGLNKKENLIGFLMSI
ncbi:MAG: regulator [Flavobacterium sp. BFFFF1]|uniref:helix-turn-helix and ligand-binding sensor domain-containing protein n=1 Tax=Flavobacterium sp. BFFFF1 TaxID=2015557 RepID=UPI000BC7D8AE|nr:triple tyrosine motif-containing protein [Flavobacterium sp. BFFFF1]OYU79549.1 MAG: regulator [Flavobacterium sp. BFFFF1]